MAEEVLSATEAITVCSLCLKQFTKYTCPRCNVRYCSVACYKSEKHMQCSELFYRDCFMEALKNERGNSEDKIRMMDMLKRLREQEGNEKNVDASVLDIEERIAHIDLENDPAANLWQALTTKEQKEFESAVQNGEIAQMVDLWKPWWSQQEDDLSRRKIEVLESHQQSEESDEMTGDSDQGRHSLRSKPGNIPTVMKNIPPADEILKGKTPSPNLRYNLIDVLYAYAYVMRFYNGSADDSAHEASESVLKLSAVLGDSVSFDCAEAVVHSCLNHAQKAEDLYNSDSFSLEVLLDTVSLIRGNHKKQKRTFVECALSDIHRLLKKGKSQLDALPDVDKGLSKAMWLARKKVYFLLAWVPSAANSLQSLVPAIQILHGEISATHTQHQEDKKKLEKVWGGTKPPQRKTLVEEI